MTIVLESLKMPVTMPKESAINAGAAILVLFTALLDPHISVGLAVLLLAGLALYHYRRGA